MLKKIWDWAKPLVTIVIVVVVLKTTGLFAPVMGMAQSAIMLTGLFNASDEAEEISDRFDYDFRVRDLNGMERDFAHYRGKVVFLNIWATWCPPCRAEMPSIEGLYQKLKDHDQIAFVMLSVDDEEKMDNVRTYIANKEHTFPVFMPSGTLPELLRVRSIPTTLVISPDGTVIKREVGMRNYNTAKFEKFLLDLTRQ